MPDHVQTMWSERNRGGRVRERRRTKRCIVPPRNNTWPVTEVGIAPWCRGGTSSKAIARLQDHHLVTRGRRLEGRGQPGEAAAHHDHRCMLRPHDGTAWALRKGRGAFMRSSAHREAWGRAARCHDRGHLLWTSSEGPSNRLLASIDRWVGAVLTDDGIDMPLMGRGSGNVGRARPF